MFHTERIAEARDIWAAVVDVSCWIGRGIRRDMQGFYGDFMRLFQKKDPKRHARTPPKGWHTATPEGNVPARKSKAVEVDLNAYTPEEILAMTEAEYGQKIGLLGVHSWQESRKEAQKQIAKKSRGSNAKPVEIEL